MKRPRTWVLLAVTALVAVAATAAVAATTFTDVPDDSIYHDDISWLADAGVTKGCNPPDNDEYCPDEAVSREQMAAFMHRLATNQVVDAATVGGLTADDLQSGGEADPASPSHLSGVYRTFDFDTFEGVDGVLPGESDAIASIDLDPARGSWANIDFGSVVFQGYEDAIPDEITPAFAVSWLQAGEEQCNAFVPELVLPDMVPGSLVGSSLIVDLPSPLSRSATLEVTEPTTVTLCAAYGGGEPGVFALLVVEPYLNVVQSDSGSKAVLPAPELPAPPDPSGFGQR